MVHSMPPVLDHLPVTDLVDAGRVKHFEILERVAVDDDQIGFEADAHAAELAFLAQNFRVVSGRMLDDLERRETRPPAAARVRGAARSRTSDR